MVGSGCDRRKEEAMLSTRDSMIDGHPYTSTHVSVQVMDMYAHQDFHIRTPKSEEISSRLIIHNYFNDDCLQSLSSLPLLPQKTIVLLLSGL